MATSTVRPQCTVFLFLICFYNNISQFQTQRARMNLASIQIFRDDIECFHQEYPQSLENPSKMPIQASANFYLPTSRPQTQGSDHDSDLTFELCIVGPWILQREIPSKSIISVLRCDYHKSYEIIRRGEGQPNSKKRQYGLRVIFKAEDKVSLELFATHSSQLQSFTKILQAKPIFQVGFFQNYKPVRRLASGSTSIVYSVLRFEDSKSFAVKCSKKRMNVEGGNMSTKESFINEITLWKRLDHPNIAKLHTAYHSDNSVYMVTDLLPLTLFNFVKMFGFPKKNIAKKIIKDLIGAVSYLHDLGIMHRDIKLENIMIKKGNFQHGDVTPVIVDFGLALEVSSSKSHMVRCGTPGYTAPEILSLDINDPAQGYSQICDIFSLGVVAFTLLKKRFPFEGQTAQQILRKNNECLINFKGDSSDTIDNDQTVFLEGMLSKDPFGRLTAKQAFNHPFLSFQEPPVKSTEECRQGKATSVSLACNQ